MKSTLCLLMSLLTLSILAGVPGGVRAETPPPLTLTRDGRPAATIVLAAEPTRVAQLAAFELQAHIKLISGAETPIVRGTGTVAGVRILVGESDATRALGLRGADFRPQEYLVRFSPDVVVLIGRDKDDRGPVKYDFADPLLYETWPDFYDDQGSLYAAYAFLEQCCGVRWYNPTELGTVTPRQPTLTVRAEEIRRRPFMDTRMTFTGNLNADFDLDNCLWTAKDSPGVASFEAASFPALQRQFTNAFQRTLAKRTANGIFLRRMRAGGAKRWANHSLYGYYARFWEQSADVSAAKVFVARNPDMFAQGYSNEAVPPQMCYTSRELIERVAQDARDYFDAKGFTAERAVPGSGVYAGTMWGPDCFAVEPMDNDSYSAARPAGSG